MCQEHGQSWSDQHRLLVRVVRLLQVLQRVHHQGQGVLQQDEAVQQEEPSDHQLQLSGQFHGGDSM